MDVRSEAAFNARNLGGDIVNIPYAELAKSWKLARLRTDKPLLVVCVTGMMSSQAGAILGMLGYKLRILSGGMAAVPAS